MGLLRMACLVTCPLIKVNHFKHSVFITPELSSNAGFVAHDSAMASLCSFLCISSVLSSSTAVSQNQGSVPPTSFYLHLSLFPRFPIHIQGLLPHFHLETELRGSLMASILIPLPLYVRSEPRIWPRTALHSVPQDGTQEASFGWGLPSHWRERDKWGKWKQLSKNNENRTIYLASPPQMHRLTPPKITKTSLTYLFIYSTNIS